jgi:hypothetical protein
MRNQPLALSLSLFLSLSQPPARLVSSTKLQILTVEPLFAHKHTHLIRTSYTHIHTSYNKQLTYTHTYTEKEKKRERKREIDDDTHADQKTYCYI